MDDALRAALGTFGRRAFELLKDRLQENQEPVRVERRMRFDDLGRMSQVEVRRQNWDPFVERRRDELLNLPELEAAARIAYDTNSIVVRPNRDTIFARPTGSFDDVRSPYQEQLISCVVGYLHFRNDDVVYDEALFTNIAGNYWAEPKLVLRLIVPLPHAYLPWNSPITLAHDISISRMTGSERTTLYNAISDSEFREVFRSEWALRWSRTIDRLENPNEEQEIKLAWTTASAMRLTTRGAVSAPVLAILREPTDLPGTINFVGRSQRLGHSLEDLRGPKAGLGEGSQFLPATAALVNHLQGLLAKLYEKKDLGGLSYAVRSFNRSFARQDLEDALVDLVVALEASLVGDTESEKRYRVSLHGAALLAGLHSPHDVFRAFRTAYDHRSKIVHSGGTLPPQIDGLPASTFVNNLRDKVREVLGHFVDLSTSFANHDMMVAELRHDVLESFAIAANSVPEPTPEST